MAITDDEWVKLGKLMRDNSAIVLEEVVYPQLMEIKNEIKSSGLALEKKLSDKIDGVESSLGSSIDNLAKVVTETKTNHEKRIKRLEDEVGIFAD